jgi:hypothetical protein
MTLPIDPVYSLEEQDLAVASMIRLSNPLILDFFHNCGIRKGTNKAEMKLRLVDALEAGFVSHADLYLYLNTIESWGRQHVILFDGPASSTDNWRDPAWVTDHVTRHGLSDYFNVTLPLALPTDLTLSSIEYTPAKLRITAVERREGVVREPELDREDAVADDTIIYRAYRYQVYRGLIAFEWDLVANHAFIQISQLPSGEKYEDATARFDALITHLFSLSDFPSICLRSVITRLHELEEQHIPEARSQGIAYKTLQGRTVEGRGSSGTAGLFGETIVDTTMASVRKVSVGHTGNFYWLPPDVNMPSDNPLTQDLHVTLIGDWRRINFPVFSPEPHIRYVLQRIRAIATPTS